MEILDTPLEPISIFLRSSEYTSTDIYIKVIYHLN